MTSCQRSLHVCNVAGSFCGWWMGYQLPVAPPPEECPPPEEPDDPPELPELLEEMRDMVTISVVEYWQLGQYL